MRDKIGYRSTDIINIPKQIKYTVQESQGAQRVQVLLTDRLYDDPCEFLAKKIKNRGANWTSRYY